MSAVARVAVAITLPLLAFAATAGERQALWFDDAGRLRPEAREAVALLEAAADDGLEPSDYPIPVADDPSFDCALTASVLRYLQDVRFGRVDPGAVGFRLPPRESIDLEALLRDAVAGHTVAALAAELSPPVPMYAEMRRELAGRRTLPGEARHVRQIELSLERLRWLPHFPPQRILAVNIPMFRVWGMGDPAASRFSTGVIVGRAFKTATPLLIERMEYVVFRPYWNIPSSILRGEILPALRRTPDYLQRHSMEIVSGDFDATRVVPITTENVAGLRQGKLRVRQRPGPQNSLGLVKFVFPNDENVYLHGTPAQELFARSRRDFSHGCIRVADPVGLAEWVLSAEPGWSRDRIVAAMDGPDSTRVDLTRSIPVILFYLTAMPIDGVMHFADDIYGHDARLDRYLRARRDDRRGSE
jgi:murein L,D-transpeptidase YcbB/YkuD